MSDEERPFEKAPIDWELVKAANLNRATTFQAIGHFIFSFSQLELTVRVALSAYLNLDDTQFNAVTGPYDFRMLCAVARKVGPIKYPQRADEFEKIFKECYALNDERNHVAHGLWTDGIDEFSVRMFNRQKLDAADYPYSSEELHALAAKAQDLMQRVMGFQGKTEIFSGQNVESHSLPEPDESEGTPP